MTNMKHTKRALLTSLFALFLCFCMLLGTTYAWFTDSVTSKNNIIQSGTLDVEMYYADGDEDPATVTWLDASKGAIFDYDKWEPGYVDAKHIKVANAGTLSLSYQIRIVANGTLSKLADVIDVYYYETGTKLTRDSLVADNLLGTLTEVMGTSKNIANKVQGVLVPEGKEDATTGEYSTRTLTLAFKMREGAGNEYQDLSIGTDFAVQVIATQASASFEKDSFDEKYDAATIMPDVKIPSALVRPLENRQVNYMLGIGGAVTLKELNVAYQFEPTSTFAEAQKSMYRYWHADYVVYADKDVPADSMALAGYYKAWCGENGPWVALTSDADIKTGTQIRLVKSLGAEVNWEEICEYGNDGVGFKCGAVDLTGVNAGTTLTVELRLYETTKAWNDTSSATANEETGKYLTVASFKYTFPSQNADNNKTVKTAEELQTAINEAAVGATTIINFAKDITGDVTINQKQGVNIVINGDGHDFHGLMTVFGNGRQTEAETLDIKNINFVAKEGAQSCIESPDYAVNDKHSYAHNITVENCTFTDPDGVVECAGVRGCEGGDMNWTISNCSADETMHSLLQVENIAGTLTVSGCTTKSKNGANFNQSANIVINDCNFDVRGYALRFGVGSGEFGVQEKIRINNCTLKAACESSDDAVIILRTTAKNADLKAENSVLIGDPQWIR